MLGRRSAQRGLFEGDNLYLEFVGRKTFYGFLAAQRDELFQDEDFAGMYCPDNGRPSVPPSQLSVALLLQRYEDCSDLEAWARASYDLRWKVALGTETMERPFAKSTLQLFRAQLLVHPQMRLAFERSLELAKKTGYVRNSKPVRLAMDTSQILGRGAVKDTYNLISEGIRQVLRALARVKKQKPQDYARSQGLGRHFGSSIKGESEVDWEDEDSRSRFLTELVAEAHRALRLACEVRSELRAGSPAQQRIEASCQLLATILLQDLEVKRSPDGSSEKVAIKKEASGERICSVGDPEMRHGRKSASQRFDGHKLDIATEVESQLITAVDVLAGSAPDDEGALELVQESGRALEAEVGEVLTDCAYGAGENRQQFKEAGIELRAKVPVQGSNGEHFKKSDFQIDLEANACTCPAGQTTSEVRPLGWREGKGGSKVQQEAYVFAKEVCAACSLKQSCFKQNEKRNWGRAVYRHPQEALLQEAREWQQSPDFDRFRKERQVVEHRIARMMQLGMRQARYCGRHKTLFQALTTAAVANLTLMAGKVGLLPGAEITTSAQGAASAAAKTLQTAFQSVRALLRAARGRLGRAQIGGDRPITPSILAFLTPSSRPGF